ncbi:MAG: hypothetical protein Q7T55_12650 [Solirubrobacteraceae bacterium]|nr:hypothetical protein [Solirubrobacteraceae bacterium]
MTKPDSDDPKAGTGAEGDASNDLRYPFEPRKDDETPMGDTDQHSKVDHHQDPAKEIKRGGAADET